VVPHDLKAFDIGHMRTPKRSRSRDRMDMGCSRDRLLLTDGGSLSRSDQLSEFPGKCSGGVVGAANNFTNCNAHGGSWYPALGWEGVILDRGELKKHLALIERAVEDGQLVIEKQRLFVEKFVASGQGQSEALAVLTRLLKAQRKLEDNREELRKTINS
jgi:hypothetical protein